MFRFRHFTVEDDKSTMKVGTDAMILGAWVTPPLSGRILEIGTGCGVISLMLAQKCSASITAIDIHDPSVIQAGENFQNSPWKERLEAVNVAIEDFDTPLTYDLIITNPPFFRSSLRSPEHTRNISRHDHSLTYEDLIFFVKKMLSPEGEFALVLPERETADFRSIAENEGLSCNKELLIHAVEGNSKPVRVISVFSSGINKEILREKITIRNSDRSFTREYIDLTAEYHLFS